MEWYFFFSKVLSYKLLICKKKKIEKVFRNWDQYFGFALLHIHKFAQATVQKL